MPVRPRLKNLWLRPVGAFEELFERSFAFAQDEDVFELLKTDSSTAARSGRLATAHGVVETPAFLPVGTHGSVKAVRSALSKSCRWNSHIYLTGTCDGNSGNTWERYRDGTR